MVFGIDVAQANFTAGVWEGERGRYFGAFANTPDGFDQLARLVRKEQEQAQADTVHLIMEPTGGYERELAHFALAQGWRVSLPNPRNVRDWAKGVGQRAKTDKQDALLLARYGADVKPPTWAPLPAEVSELESLLERKRDLEQMVRQERNRQQGWTGRPGVAPSVLTNVAGVVEALEAALREVEGAIR
jgi:transposase